MLYFVYCRKYIFCYIVGMLRLAMSLEWYTPLCCRNVKPCNIAELSRLQTTGIMEYDTIGRHCQITSFRKGCDGLIIWKEFQLSDSHRLTTWKFDGKRYKKNRVGVPRQTTQTKTKHTKTMRRRQCKRRHRKTWTLNKRTSLNLIKDRNDAR